MNNQPKEVAVFKTYTRYNKLKIFGIALLILVVTVCAFYFFAKSLFKYTVTYNLNGGSVYKQELVSDTYLFLSKVQEPKSVKKEGYYIEYWSKDENLGTKFNFGVRIWNSFKLHVKWAEGVAVRLHFAEGEENADMPLEDLKGYYEQYVKPGSIYKLPLVFNTTGNSHLGEQLLWYDNPECTGEPFETKQYILSESIDLYGKWFDTKKEKFDVSENGTLNSYLGYCDRVILPNNVKSIKSISHTLHQPISPDGNERFGEENISVWGRVIHTLETVYLNSELISIGESAFKDCDGLKYIFFSGDNVNSIGEYAFANCKSLLVFNPSAGYKTILTHTFEGAFDITAKVKLNLPYVERIEDSGFINSNINSIELGAINYIGKLAFAGSNRLKNINITSPTEVLSNATSLDNGMFAGLNISTAEGTGEHINIIIPKGSLSKYLNKSYWNMYSAVISESEK